MNRRPYAPKKLSRFEQSTQEEQRRARRESYPPTEEMRRAQEEYKAMLEARKRGDAPLYVTADGREYR
jgi:hypothetical protein